MEGEFVQLKPMHDIREGYLREFPIAHALFRTIELQGFAGQQLKRPVLDLGCGTGQFATLVAESRLDAGVDVCKKRLGEARTRGCYLDLREGDARALPFDDESFETIVSLSALEHMPEPERVIAEAFRVLRPGGLFLATVVLSDLHRHLLLPGLLRGVGWAELGRWYEQGQDRVFQHRTLLSEDVWKKTLRGHGFAVLESERVVGPRVTRLWDALLWTAWPFHFLGRLGKGLTRRPHWLRRRLAEMLTNEGARKEDEGSVLYFVARKPAPILLRAAPPRAKRTSRFPRALVPPAMYNAVCRAATRGKVLA